MQNLGFRPFVSGFKVQDSEFRFWGFRVWGLWFRVKSFEFRVLGLGFRV